MHGKTSHYVSFPWFKLRFMPATLYTFFFHLHKFLSFWLGDLRFIILVGVSSDNFDANIWLLAKGNDGSQLAVGLPKSSPPCLLPMVQKKVTFAIAGQPSLKPQRPTRTRVNCWGALELTCLIFFFPNVRA